MTLHHFNRRLVMSTTAQIEANRLNAQSSTGPTSPEGKAKSSLNALSHGFYSKHPLLPDEDPAELELLRSSLIESYKPQDGAELLLVERIVSSQWKLQRLNKLEAKTMEAPFGESVLRDLERLSRLAQQLDSAMHRAIKALRELRKEKQKQEQEKAASNLRNEPNCPSKSRLAKGLGLDEQELGGFSDTLAEQMSRDLPHFAAAAVAQKSQKTPIGAAQTR
jgi:hypothetical protein